MGQQRRYGTSRGIIAAGLALCLMPATGGCVARDYAGIPLQPGAAPADVQALAGRARGGDKEAQLELGKRFEQGEGVSPDINQAMTLYEAAAADSGGAIWVYSPPVGNGSSGRVVQIDRGPTQEGLPEAQRQVMRLRAKQ